MPKQLKENKKKVEKKSFLARLKAEPLLALLVAVIVVLLIANVFFALSALGFFKKTDFAEKRLLEAKHSELTKNFAQIEADFPGKALLDKNTLESAFLYNLYQSLLEDVQFFKKLETENYSLGSMAETESQAKEAFAREAAIEFAFQTIVLLNTYPAAEQYWQYFEKHYEEEIGLAEEKLPQIKPEGFVSSEISSELIAQARIKKESIEKETTQIITAYLELRKKAFEKALNEKNNLRAFVEANKIIGLHELCGGT
ncbi:MAG: hypothetical protein QXK06_00205 [Candidatus Diapherotrites archaeon]